MLEFDERRLAYERSVLSEIRMLLDYLAAQPDQSLADFRIRDGKSAGADLDIGAIVARLGEIERRISGPGAAPLSAEDAGLLIVLRDVLVQRTKPASGLTIAYTAIVAGNLRGAGSESRTTMAEAAYPNLIASARFHRVIQRMLLALVVIVTGAAVWESAKVSLGRSLLQDLEGLGTQKENMALEKAKLEAALFRPIEGPVTVEKLLDEHKRISLAAFAICDHPTILLRYIALERAVMTLPAAPSGLYQVSTAQRPYAGSPEAADAPDSGPPDDRVDGQPPRIYESPQERDVCERDRVLATNFTIVHDDLRRYLIDWPGMVGSVFATAASMLRAVGGFVAPITAAKPQQPVSLDPGARCPNGQPSRPQLPHCGDDVEFLVAPVLLVWSNYVLPVLFGLLGSLIFVILDFYGKVCASRLHPRDGRLAPIRLVLGLVTGTCIGLFFSAAGRTVPGNAASVVTSLTLSASGLAFLAGFGVEGVFGMLDALVRKVFTSEAK
ncbi:MAG: hypothetical protein J0I21_08475 [Alphaproteobacteria bacterium]|nr:hypothetical protein [Alphaproteobacteria bacterium]